ncbi:hypothetical protein BZB76_6099 [Actinomadura pelletieri DSM 43383]|uniref:Secreted protein n=1 Tax=Actinomadura pelletieri DSM 43383 TaxID=1120940 RepID=A0A495QBP4_9ACTN|nr:DUF6493 family protein [Actinomadura pelletieri]RKS68961.1 hypothetical protein BZB76_6099 [Actinomadura pelletieri DSM 43383]
MSAWDDVRKALETGDGELTARLVAALDEPGRRAVAKELPGELKRLRAETRLGFLEEAHIHALLVAGAGTINGAAAAATWLCRADLRPRLHIDTITALCRWLCDVTSRHPDEWRADVAHRIAARIQVAEEGGARWHIVAALVTSAGAAVPVTDGFVVGWAASQTRAQTLGDDPFLDALVPKIFEVDGVGAVLSREAVQGAWNMGPEYSWSIALVGLARAGRLERGVLLDGCVNRFLRGGTPHTLRWFVQLHDALETTDDEVVARVRDYARLLPAAPSIVAELALREVRRADDLGRLDEPLFEEAAGAVLFRPEKKFLRAALSWLDRTARQRDRVDATLRTVAAVFSSDVLDLQERAVRIAVKHASRAGDAVRAQIRDAAEVLPADLRATIGAAFGEIATAAEAAPEPPGPPPFTPRESPAPIGSLTELVDEYIASVRREPPWRTVERLLGALVEFAYRDLDGTMEALRQAMSEHVPWFLDRDGGSHLYSYTNQRWVELAVWRHLYQQPTLAGDARNSFLSHEEGEGHGFWPRMERFLTWRKHEAAFAVGKLPVLLATPTEGSGHVDPDVLVGRLERLERAGLQPGPADLTQALLRLPRDIDASVTARAKGLKSEAGRAVASWLAEGGLADPDVECRVLDQPTHTLPGDKLRFSHHVLAPVEALDHPDVARLCAFPEEGWSEKNLHPGRYHLSFWPSVAPSHREIVAAHLVPQLAVDEAVDYGYGQGAVLLDLAEADGPTGAATGTILACSLTSRDPRERAGVVEALLAFSGRGHLPAAETGAALGQLVVHGRIVLSRAVKALTSAADAGAHADVWTTVAAALPHVLPEPGERAPAGVPDLLALGTRVAETTGARGPIPRVADVAARGGTSRLVKESARLHRTLAT